MIGLSFIYSFVVGKSGGWGGGGVSGEMGEQRHKLLLEE
jgi:hypothetical protein